MANETSLNAALAEKHLINSTNAAAAKRLYENNKKAESLLRLNKAKRNT